MKGFRSGGLLAQIEEAGHSQPNHLVSEPFILLVDDDKDWLFLSRVQLAKAGVTHTVTEAHDGEKAISICSSSLNRGAIPLFVLLDINMPRVSGFEVLEWIRAEPRLDDVPVIMLSSSQLEADLFRAKTLGADAFLAKGDNVASFSALYRESKEIGTTGSNPANSLAHLPGNLFSAFTFELE
jgi:CheY-like chemotaxis protein